MSCDQLSVDTLEDRSYTYPIVLITINLLGRSKQFSHFGSHSGADPLAQLYSIFRNVTANTLRCRKVFIEYIFTFRTAKFFFEIRAQNYVLKLIKSF